MPLNSESSTLSHLPSQGLRKPSVAARKGTSRHKSLAGKERVRSWCSQCPCVSGTKIRPKGKFSGRISRGCPGVIRADIPAQNFGQGPQSPGKTSIWARTSMTRRRGRPRPQGTFKNFGQKNLWLNFRSLVSTSFFLSVHRSAWIRAIKETLRSSSSSSSSSKSSKSSKSSGHREQSDFCDLRLLRHWDRGGGGQNVLNARGGVNSPRKLPLEDLDFWPLSWRVFFRISIERGQFQGPPENSKFSPLPLIFGDLTPPPNCDAHGGPQKSLAISETRQSNAALRGKARWKVAGDSWFGAAISESESSSFCGIAGDLGLTMQKSLAIAIVRFGAPKGGGFDHGVVFENFILGLLCCGLL